MDFGTYRNCYESEERLLKHTLVFDSYAKDGKREVSIILMAATADGGGQVVLPSGTYLCGSIRMKSNVELHLTAGATILLEEEATCRYFRQVRQEGNRTMDINKVKTTEVWALYNNIIIIFA